MARVTMIANGGQAAAHVELNEYQLEMLDCMLSEEFLAAHRELHRMGGDPEFNENDLDDQRNHIAEIVRLQQALGIWDPELVVVDGVKFEKQERS